MKTKEKLLHLLVSCQNDWVSGEDIAKDLQISRAAVWKAVNSLRNEGYIIDAVRRKGYRLVSETDVLSELGIWQYLNPECKMLDIQVLQEVGSTNEMLREKAISGCPEGTVLVAAMQTDGKGRMGRRFYSPADTGVYMSILLRPVSIHSSKALRLTTMAAVAVCEAIESVSGKSALIKWVNDVYVDSKKVCGILTEGSVSLETGSLDYAILGVGINIYCPEKGFPAEIENIAGYIFDEKERDVRNKISASFLNNFFKYYLNGDFDSYIAEYRRRSFVIGKKIEVINGEESRNAVAVDVDSSCQLIVRYEDGTSEHLSAGEISIRL